MKPNIIIRLLALAATAGSCFAHNTGVPHGDGGDPQDMSSAMTLFEVLLAQKPDATSSRPALQNAIAGSLLKTATSSQAAAAPSAPAWFSRKRPGTAIAEPPMPFTHTPNRPLRSTQLLASAPLNPLSFGVSPLSFGFLASFQPPAGNGSLMAASFQPFKPYVRYYSDTTTFYMQSDNGMSAYNTWMPNRMVGITAWQQQVPIATSYFAGTTDTEGNAASLSYKQPNYWRLPLVPTVSASPQQITATTFTLSLIHI